jgi:hypothetical protein
MPAADRPDDEPLTEAIDAALAQATDVADDAFIAEAARLTLGG